MTDRELLEQALLALDSDNPDIQLRTAIALREALAKPEPAQVSPMEFNHMTLDKEHMVGKPIFWAEWPNKEKA